MPESTVAAPHPARTPWRTRAVVTAAAAAALAFVGSTGAAHADEPVAEEDIEAIHDVVSGDHLNGIAEHYGLDSWRPVWDANPDLDDPDVIAVGDELVIPEPDADVEARELPGSEPAATGADGGGDGADDSAQRQEPATSRAGTWDRLAECESNGNWSINTGNGYYGGLQFAKQSWDAVSGTEFAAYPHQASREQQIQAGERLLAEQGWGAWPACSRQLGLR